jgi:hypothetical protein
MDCVIVDHADCLHEGVTDGGADKSETALLQVPAHGVGFGGPGGKLFQRPPGVPLGFAAHELPNVPIEASEFLLNGKKGPGVLGRGLDFEPVANNARIAEQPFRFAAGVPGDLFYIEIIE